VKHYDVQSRLIDRTS